MEGLTIHTDEIKNKYVTIGDLAKGRKNNLDFIRFIAAIMVLYSHAFPLGAGTNTGEIIKDMTNNNWSFGSMGVAIFFVISGYLITQSYELSNNIISFTKSRILRIFPGLGVALLFSTVVLGFIASTLPVIEFFKSPLTYQYLKSFFLYPMYWYLPGVFEDNVYKGSVNGSLWTIPFEVLCYLIVAILGFIGLLKNKKIILFLFIINLFYFLFYSTISPAGGTQIVGLQLITLIELFTYFSAGMVLYTYRNFIPHDKHLAMISIVILLLSIYYTGLKELFIFFGCYLVFYIALAPSIKLSNFSKYGDFSYGLYIYAFPVQQYITYIHGGMMDPHINFLYSLVITFVLSVLSWHVVEKNFLKLKKVRILPRIVPQHLNIRDSEVLRYPKLMMDRILLLIGRAKFGWISFLLIVIISGFLLNNYSKTPSIITFPYAKSNSIFHEGWLPQAPAENYRWVAGSASVEMAQAPKTSTIVIEGFLPETFVDVNKLNVLVNNNSVGEITLVPGQAISFAANLPENKSKRPLDLLVSIQFNSIFKPDETAPDRREMSALISKIIIR